MQKNSHLDTGIIQLMLSPSTYSHPVKNVEHIQTHISHVFLTGSYAYKIKKSVKFDFLDFSTLEKRKFFCERELRLNSRFAPNLYEAVLPITQEQNRLFLTGVGVVIEYALRMKQFDNHFLFSNLIEHGLLTEDHLLEVTRKIAAFHREAEHTPDYWSVGDINDFMEVNLKVCRRFTPEVLDGSALEQLRSIFEVELEKLAPLITKRQQTHVKSLHGDLHLKNICLFQGQATLFDGIEFNDRYSCCDVWADMAFLLMDLRFRGHPEFVASVLNCYLEETDDFEGLLLLSLYISYRAAVRVKVSCLSLESSLAGEERDHLEQEARNYLALAYQSLISTRSQLIAIGGLSGSGKSVLARGLAKKLGGIHIRSDSVRKHLAGVALHRQAPEAAYTSDMNEKTYEGLLTRAKFALQAGRAMILDAVFLSENWRKQVEDFAKENDLVFHGLWCEVPLEEARRRLRERKGDISDADEKILEMQIRSPIGNLTWTRMETIGSPDQLVERVAGMVV